jgi:hypothetical protein
MDHDSLVTVTMKPGKVRVRGEGVNGWYDETKKVKYDGEPLEFQIAPKLLIDFTKRHKECEIAPERLIVRGERYTYVSCLLKPQENGKEPKEEE